MNTTPNPTYPPTALQESGVDLCWSLPSLLSDNCKDFPKCEYIGLSSRPYRNRLAEHKQYIRSKNVDKSSGYHFNKSGHNLSHLAGLVLEHVKSDDAFVLRAREYLYIQKFDCYRNGLNMEP